MLKLEIKLDEAKIKSEHKYDVISIYQTLEKSFFKYDIPMNKEKDGFLPKRTWKRLWCLWSCLNFAERKGLVHGLCY